MSGLAERTPLRERGRCTTGFAWGPPEDAPGGVLPADVQRRLQEELRNIDECAARARISGASYVIYR